MDRRADSELHDKQLDDLAFLTAAELAADYRAGAFMPRDVVDAHLSRIKAMNGAIHAYIDVYDDTARVDAEASTQRFARGAQLGPLDGIPVAIKDLIEIEGRICMAGSAIRRDYVATRTATIVKKLIAQGAIVLGKVHTVEFALGGWGTNAYLGAPRNPWGAEVPHTPGGSSSGSATAVAARLATLAVGTDTGGSVRGPAGFNGLVGLKTTSGRISLHGVVPLSPTLDTIGPIARSVSDAALLYEAMIGLDPLDPATARIPHGDPFASLDAGVRGMTLAVIDAREREHIHPEIIVAYDAALKIYGSLGAKLVTINLPKSLADFAKSAEIMMGEAYALYGTYAEDANTPMDPGVRARVLTGAVPAKAYIEARWRAQADAQAMLEAFGTADALLTPTSRTPPIPLAEVDESTTPAILTRFVNQIGFCGLAIPNGFTGAGLPTSLQIVCRPYQEDLALRIGRAHERATMWHTAVPPMAQRLAGPQ
jgi:aspartyl-tRNA(Asn)/glutamyl-tRNA(Gln) amidotransferase subunit A